MATASTSPKSVPSENILSSKTDLCISNGIVKLAVGFGVGVVASAVLFRRRAWPVFIGTGFGLGQGYSDCERIFNPASIPGYVLAERSSTPTTYAAFNPFSAATTEKVEGAIKVAQEKLSEVVGAVKEVEQKAEKKVEAVVAKKDDKKLV